MGKKEIIIGVAIVAVAVLCWYMFSAVLSDYGERIDSIGRDLQSVRDQQRHIDERLGIIQDGLGSGAAEAGRVSEGLGDVAVGIAETEGRIEASQGRIGNSAELIIEGKQILRQIRERGKAGD